jgi:hypothetical protein
VKRALLLGLSHVAAIGVGMALGIYLLPILIAPAPPAREQIESLALTQHFAGTFRRDLEDSDLLHWGEGTVRVTARAIAFEGRLAPGPDYKLYLSPQFVETEADFARLKPSMRRVGDVKTFENFLVAVPEDIDVSQFSAVIVWCETFSQFITAAKYR